LEEFVEDMQGPLILFSEIKTPLVELKAKKAEGPAGIDGELLKSLGSTGKQVFLQYVIKYTRLGPGQMSL